MGGIGSKEEPGRRLWAAGKVMGLGRVVGGGEGRHGNGFWRESDAPALGLGKQAREKDTSGDF